MSDVYLDGLLNELVPAEPLERWDDVVQRARRSQRRYTLLVVAIAVLVLPPVTWAAVRTFEGTPAPPPVRHTFTYSNQARGAFERQFARVAPQADASKAHGVLQVHTAYGPVDLWAAPATDGRVCFLLGAEADRLPGPNGLQLGSEEGCIPRSGPPRPLVASVSGESGPHGSYTVLWGYAKGPVTTVRVRLSNGRTITLPVIEHFFLANPKGAEPTLITGRDAHGNVIETWKEGQ